MLTAPSTNVSLARYTLSDNTPARAGDLFLQTGCKQMSLQSFSSIQSGASISLRLEARPAE